MALIPISEYAARHGKNASTIRIAPERFSTLVKNGRNWLIDENEPWPLHSATKRRYARYEIVHDPESPDDNNVAQPIIVPAVQSASRIRKPDTSKSHCVLRNCDLSGANLSGANLAYADLTGANLTSANLSGANLAYADLTDANLTDANLTGVDFTGANLANAKLAGADLTCNGNIVTQ